MFFQCWSKFEDLCKLQVQHQLNVTSCSLVRCGSSSGTLSVFFQPIEVSWRKIVMRKEYCIHILNINASLFFQVMLSMKYMCLKTVVFRLKKMRQLNIHRVLQLLLFAPRGLWGRVTSQRIWTSTRRRLIPAGCSTLLPNLGQTVSHGTELWR